MQKLLHKKGPKVLLVYMPIGELLWPSIGLSLLKSSLSLLNISTKILYFNLRFAKFIGAGPYLKTLQSTHYNQIGEWIFSGALFKQSNNAIESYVEEILHRPYSTTANVF